MPQHKSAEKRVRQSAKRRLQNKAVVSKMKTLTKKVRDSKTRAEGETSLRLAVKLLDQMGTKGFIPKNRASNQKSRLTKFVHSLPAEEAKKA